MKKISTKAWVAVIAVILGLCVAFTAYVFLKPHDAADEPVAGPVAVVNLNGEIVDAVDLGKVNESYTKTYGDENGDHNVVEFSHGEARVIEATCPDQVCISQGWVDENSILPIACLPNSLIVQIIPVEEDAGELDGTTR